MRITFVLPFINHRGGTQFILELADLLVGLGDEVSCIWPTRLKPLPWLGNELEFLWRAPWKLLRERWFQTKALVYPVPSLKPRYLPAADVIVATAWKTASWVHAAGPETGRKAYFIFEPETHDDPEGCGRTYRLPFDYRFTISSWSAEQLQRRFGMAIDRVFPIGLKLENFPERTRPPADRVRRIGLLYDRSAKKGFEDGYEAFLAARAQHPELELHLMGFPRRAPQFPDFVKTHFRITHDEKIALYHHTDVWLSSSLEEGWGLVPMEAMACGNAVITTRVGGTPYFAVDGKTAVVVEPNDRASLIEGLKRLVDDGALRSRLVAAGTERARSLTLTRTARDFRQSLVDAL